MQATHVAVDRGGGNGAAQPARGWPSVAPRPHLVVYFNSLRIFVLYGAQHHMA